MICPICRGAPYPLRVMYEVEGEAYGRAVVAWSATTFSRYACQCCNGAGWVLVEDWRAYQAARARVGKSWVPAVFNAAARVRRAGCAA